MNGALEVRGIQLAPDAITVTAEGFNEVEGKVPVLNRIHAHYTLRVPEGSREVVDRALERHVSRCPTAQSLNGAVEVTWSADISEEPAA